MSRQKISLRTNEQKKDKQVDLQELFKEYEKEKMTTASAATIRGLKHKIMPFINWLLENNHTIDQSSVNDYIIYIKSKHDNKATITSYSKHVRAFCNWAHENNYCPKIKICIKNDYEPNKEVYTKEELAILLKKPSTNNFNDVRNWAMINFFIGTGCRINTLINVKISDVDFNEDTITFNTTKNSKQQILPLCLQLKKALRSYLKEWPNEPNDYLFPNQYGEQLVNNSVTHAINKYNKSRGVGKTSCHLFRHTFAHNYLLSGGDIFRLQKILGHSTLDMVRIYANMNSVSALKTNFDDFNMLSQVTSTKKTIKCK